MSSKKITFSLDSNFHILGVITEKPIYVLASELNKKLNYSLAWADEYVLDNAKERQQFRFNRFIQKDEEKELEILLISNIFKDAFLFKKFKDFTAFILFRDSNLFQIEQIKTLQDIILVKEIQSKEVKGIELIWEISNTVKFS